MVNLAANPTTSFREVTGWRDAINESVHTSDDQDIGDVEAVLRKVEQFIALKRLQDHFFHHSILSAFSCAVSQIGVTTVQYSSL